MMSFSSAPTDSPVPREGTVTARSIIIEWDELACLDRNGVITGYIVEARTSGTLIRTVNVNDGSAREATVSGLHTLFHCKQSTVLILDQLGLLLLKHQVSLCGSL